MSKVRSRVRASMVVMLLVGSLNLVPAASALAACGSVLYTVGNGGSTRIPFSGVPTFKNGPGGTMTVTKSYTGTATFSVTAGASSEVNAVLAKAQVSISASLTASNSTTATNSYTHVITVGKYGHAQYVSWGTIVNWQKTRINANCSKTPLASGTIYFPSTSEGWYYWETST